MTNERVTENVGLTAEAGVSGAIAEGSQYDEAPLAVVAGPVAVSAAVAPARRLSS